MLQLTVPCRLLDLLEWLGDGIEPDQDPSRAPTGTTAEWPVICSDRWLGLPMLTIGNPSMTPLSPLPVTEGVKDCSGWNRNSGIRTGRKLDSTHARRNATPVANGLCGALTPMDTQIDH